MTATQNRVKAKASRKRLEYAKRRKEKSAEMGTSGNVSEG